MMDAIMARRSVRKYKSTPLPKEAVAAVLQAGTLAPSSKNRQPWRFVVATGAAKGELLAAMERGLRREKSGDALLPGSAQYLSGAEQTLRIMRQAPVVVLVVNPLGLGLTQPLSAEQRIYEMCNAQSVGAALENMCLAATELGLGSLWICDTYFAQRELSEWLRTEGELCAALALGHPDEAPRARPRKTLEEIVEWREG